MRFDENGQIKVSKLQSMFREKEESENDNVILLF